LEDLFKQIRQDLDDRKTWEERQAIAYKLRFGQIRRRLRPYPHASDFTWPLIDSAIERKKPAYVEQVLGPEQIASFASKNPSAAGFTTAVGQWFDWRVRYKSNFEKQIQYCIDSMLVNGKGFLKTFYSPEKCQTEHQSIYPTMCVTPVYTEELSEAERCCHIIHIPRKRYERVADKYGYNPESDFIDRIAGRPTDDSYHQAKDLREGLGWVKQQDIIVVWEVYVKEKDGIWVHTFSPMMPKEEIRPAFRLPYRHKKIPIVQYDYEITDTGFYSPRGVTEIMQIYQSILKMLLDMQMDYMQYCNRPVFQPADNAPSTNYNNINLAPGQVINGRLELLTFPQPPMNFEEAQQSIRAIAQERIATPDYGIGDEGKAGQGKKTATEVQQLGSVKESGVNLSARVFGNSFTQTLQMTFDLECQYFGEDLGYFYQKNYETLPQEALKHVYELEPNGSKDGFSRLKELQKLLQVRQTMIGQPHIKIAELDKKILERVDPLLIKDVYLDPQIAEQNEILAEYDEIQAMVNGAQIQVEPADDDKSRIQAIEAFKQYCQSTPGKMPTPDVQLRIIEHEDQHIEQLKQKDPDFYRQNKQQLDQILKANQKIAQGIVQQAQQQLQQQQAAGGQGGAPATPSAGAPAAPGGGMGVPPGAVPQAGQPQPPMVTS
jgi:hypothetical protein